MWTFREFDQMPVEVSTQENFDQLLIPPEHPSRSASDTYYVAPDRVIRTHTSAHQVELLRLHDRFLVTGPVARKDEIDATHYPVFHQMEGVAIVDGDPVEELKRCLNNVLEVLFPGQKPTWAPDYFPFTN